ncbi:hypothetical protein Q7C36_010492 [Tachysurus vachellii]|uniref:Uncharacterized protein n=1 Tax=Tachysurus vachellii TaxID=175792 RepID=A0AA88MZ14_TACVA|nr:hypothetical protein Q7C36_010492 [Tachysurus vachellii]
MTKPQEKRLTRRSRVEDTDECLENCQSSDEDDYAPQISVVPTITSERFIQEYDVIRKPTEVPLNWDSANRISPNVALVPRDDSEPVNAGDVSLGNPSELEYLPGTECSPEMQNLPEVESSCSPAEPVKENLKERKQVPQVEEPTLDVLNENQRKQDNETHLQTEETTPDVSVQNSRLSSPDPDEDETDQDETNLAIWPITV